jgi:hypothetical protein
MKDKSQIYTAKRPRGLGDTLIKYVGWIKYNIVLFVYTNSTVYTNNTPMQNTTGTQYRLLQ